MNNRKQNHEIENFFCFSHGIRLRFIIKAYVSNIEPSSTSNNPDMFKLIKNITSSSKCPGFMNGCIFKFNIKKEGNLKKITMSLVYSGELDQFKNIQFFVTPDMSVNQKIGISNTRTTKLPINETRKNEVDKYINFIPVSFLLNQKISDKFRINEYNIYFVRHGQGFHNIEDRFKLLFDPKLTQKGELQTYNSGVAFKEIADISNFKFSTSDLLRTRLTLENFLHLCTFKTPTFK